MIELPTKKYRNQIHCPNCGQKGCFEHCNYCGIPIKWKDEQGDARYDTSKDGRRVRVIFEHDYSLHRCMQGGTKDGKFYNTRPVEPIKIREYDYHQMNMMCIECARTFNKLIYPLCPSCWKMECRSCGDKVPWRANVEGNKCFKCGRIGARDPVHLWNSYNRLYGKREF